MSNASVSWLCTLPVEILHRIFDSLDAFTIILSLRITCRRLKAIVDNYDRYALDFRSISKFNFQLLCRLVDPRKVISLVLAPMEETLDQTELFTTYFRVRQFNRLCSLTLINIKENELKVILKRFHQSSLTSFSFSLGPLDGRRTNTTAALLSSIIAQPNLHHLDLDINVPRVGKLSWPEQCKIRYLKISTCTDVHQILTILRCSPHLRTMVVTFEKYTSETVVRQNSFPTSFQQITSLTLENVTFHMTIDNLEFVLSLMPSLIYLKITGSGEFMNGNRWEQFIQTNLPFLNQFELFIHRTSYNNTIDIKSIVTSFQTPFWLEHKKWFVTCDHRSRVGSEDVTLYSVPICQTSLTYIPESTKVFLSTFNPISNNTASIMDNVNTIKLIASHFSLHDMNQQEESSNNFMFRKVTKLELHYDVNRLTDWIPLILKLIDLTTVTEIKLTGREISASQLGIIADLTNLLQQAYNLTSLDICCQYEYRRTNLSAQNICAMTPLHVKHLAMSIKDLNEAKICLEHLQNLATARFFYRSANSLSRSLIEWLEHNRPGSSRFVGRCYTMIWFRNNSIQPKTVKAGNKRVKLTDEHHS